MRIENYIDLSDKLGVSGLFFAAGDFGTVDGKTVYEKSCEGEKTIFAFSDDRIRLQAEFTTHKNGLVVRRDKFFNLTERKMEIYSLQSRFTLTGNEYEVYTQYNGWQHESLGDWQRLVTGISASSQGIRTCDGAAPIMAFHDLYTKKNVVFHLVPNAQWQMTARKFPRNDRERVVFECGFFDRGLRLSALPGECIELPTVIFFTAESKTDLDAYKLHEWFLGKYPRKTLPILYNSWLYCFDNIDVDALINQAKVCADMGVEAFMVDAGWFGKGDGWWNQVGDWEEKNESGPRGRLSELSEKVRELGMTFGLWFEPSRAGLGTQAVSCHPDFYISGRFLDFSNPDAVDYIFDEISRAINKYNVGWVKFDFNMTIPCDVSGNAFYRYMRGQKEFIERLRRTYPDLYITNCAAGGGRMELGQAALFDDFWLSDSQGPIDGVRIVKDTVKRMPPAIIGRWCAQKYCDGFPTYHGEESGRMIHTVNATWDALVGVDQSFSEGFLIGGPMGFSCDVASFPDEYKERFKNLISDYKKEREFYRTAAARVLVDTESLIAIEYFDKAFNTCEIQLFAKATYAQNILLYPAVAPEKSYRIGEYIRSGKDITENGILVEGIKQNACNIIKLLS